MRLFLWQNLPFLCLFLLHSYKSVFLTKEMQMMCIKKLKIGLLFMYAIFFVGTLPMHAKNEQKLFAALINGMTRINRAQLATVYGHMAYIIAKQDEQSRLFFNEQQELEKYMIVTTSIKPLYTLHTDDVALDQTAGLQEVVAKIDKAQSFLLEMIIKSYGSAPLINEDKEGYQHNKEWSEPFVIDPSTECKISLTEYPCAVCKTVIPMSDYLKNSHETPLAYYERNTYEREQYLNKAYAKLAKNDPYILHKAAKMRSEQMLEYALIKGANPNQEVAYYKVEKATPLMISVLSECHSCIGILKNYDAVDTDNRALLLALKEVPNIKVLKKLIDTPEKMACACAAIKTHTQLSEKRKSELLKGLAVHNKWQGEGIDAYLS